MQKMKLKGKRVLVVGLATTGVSLAKFLKNKGADVVVTDVKTPEEIVPYLDQLRDLDIKFELGGHEVETFERSDLILVSPGVPLDIMPLREARKNSIEIISEVELAFRFINTPIIAVTGTNGKTTTTTLIGQILKTAGYKVHVGGNIGSPLIDYALSDQDKDYVVAEISSFQLDAISMFRPKVALLLNITKDHLDRYQGFMDYVHSKSRIFMNQTPEDIAVLNKDDPLVLKATETVSGKKIYFSSHERLSKGAYINGGYIAFKNGHGGQEAFDLTTFKVKGVHNIENIMGAILTAKTLSCSYKPILEVLSEFKGLEHRLEFVRTLNEITFYNDSKGTNVGSVIKSLESFTKPVILIAGGKDKGGDFSPLRELVKEKVTILILLGEAKEKIAESLKNTAPILMVQSMEEAVTAAYKKAKPGDIVLLSPACSSFDMYRDYQERGTVFKEIVRNL
jgi:UDP-N-acetylmuramoylalanine--D-glutamate ligase